MKKYLSIVLFAIIIAGIMISCKKDGSSKDYNASIKDKTWWGMLTNSGQPPEYYSVHFNTDNSFKWNQVSGEYDGKWTLNGKQLIMNFNTISLQITADVGNDNNLTNITDNNINSIIHSGELVKNPNIPLDNTTWAGTIIQAGVSKSLLLSFAAGAKIGLVIDNMLPPVTGTYIRSASGGSIRVGPAGLTAFFGVISSTGEMKGTGTVGSPSSWNVTKQ